MTDAASPLGRPKAYREPSVFTPENLLREGRRQRHRDDVPVPEVCLLDPDGDIVAHLAAQQQAVPHVGWGCYHTTLWTFELAGRQVGLVGSAVGASFSVLVAEQLAASGCRLLVSITSAGAVTPAGPPPYFVLVERAWRDEGTSHHYLPPAEWAHAPRHLLDALGGAFDGLPARVVAGASWTTDAPYRETASAIAAAEARGVLAVEMEAAALYAYAEARGRDVVCIAHVSNTMATDGDDFEKGEANGAVDALGVAAAVVTRLAPPPPPAPAPRSRVVPGPRVGAPAPPPTDPLRAGA